jgi:S-disulfanyl-L-cysteine oxidoreductase SoxD
MPDFARDSHGNLAEQQRAVGPQRGADTSQPAAAAMVGTPQVAGAFAVAQKHGCTACHGAQTKGIGPSFKEVAAQYAKRSDAEAYLAAKIKSGGQGAWGTIAMPAQALPAADAAVIAKWLATGALLPAATR